jgi:hypothetical protein
MRFTILFIVTYLGTSLAFAQPLCDFLGKDSLTIQVVGDTINIWDLAACGNCASLFAVSVSISSDTLYIMQEDTSSQMANCDCLFNLRTSLAGAPPGIYWAVICRDWHKKIPALPQPLYIGSIQFEYNPHNSPGFSFSAYQSSCLSDAVEQHEERLPGELVLLPNFPNPFNPSTTIWFQMSKMNFVELKVYDPLGRAIQTLVSGIRLPGLHSVTFDATSLSSGAYYIRMNAGTFSQTRMMVLAR